MSDASANEVHELRRRVTTLEKKVSDLYARLGQAEPELDELVDPAGDPEVIALIQQGNQIEAIKRHRELTGTDLAAAKEAVDRLAKLYLG